MSGTDNIQVTKPVGDKANQPVTVADNDHMDRFQDELQKLFMASSTKDRTAERTGGGGPSDNTNSSKDPYEYSRKATIATLELKDLLSKQLPDSTVVNDGRGDMTVAQLRENLQKTIREQFTTGIGQADALKQTGSADSVESVLTQFRQDPNGEAKRQALAKEFGMDPATVTLEQVQALQKNANLTAQQKQNAQSFYQLELKYQDLNQLRISPSVVRLQYADVLAAGLLNPDAAGATSGRVPISDVTDAFALVHQAGSLDQTGDVRNTSDYQAMVATTTNEFAQSQSQRGSKMVDAVKSALASEKTGDTKGAEASYKQAVQLSDGIDLSFFINTLATQKDVNVQKQMMQTITNVETAREDYARFLIQQGRPSEALPLLTRIQGEVPQLASNDAAFNQLMNQALTGQKVAGDDPSVHLNNVQAAIDKKDYATAFDEVKKAQTAVQSMDTATVQKDIDALTQQKAALQKQKDALDKDTGSSDDVKKTQQALLQQQMKANDAYLQIEQNKLNLKGHVTYLEGYVDYLRGDNDAAHAKFQEFQNNYPDLAKQKAYDIDNSLKATEHQGWFKRNAKWIAPVAGVAAAIGAAALTIWSGPGAIAAAGAAFGVTEAAIGTTALLTTAAVIGTGVGASAYVGTTALSGEKVTGKTWLEGAGWGALGASMVVAPELATQLGARLGVISPTGLGMMTGAIVSVPHAAIDFTTNMAYNGQSFGQATWGFTKEAGLGTLTGGVMGRFGQSLPAIARWSTLPSLAPPVIGLGMQQFHDAKSAIHGPLDPTGDRTDISQRNAALPGTYTMPTVARPGQGQSEQAPKQSLTPNLTQPSDDNQNGG